MPIGKRTLTALTAVALCTSLVGGVLTGCNLDTEDRYNRTQDSTGTNNPATSSLMAPEAPDLGTERGGDGGG